FRARRTQRGELFPDTLRLRDDRRIGFRGIVAGRIRFRDVQRLDGRGGAFGTLVRVVHDALCVDPLVDLVRHGGSRRREREQRAERGRGGGLHCASPGAGCACASAPAAGGGRRREATGTWHTSSTSGGL